LVRSQHFATAVALEQNLLSRFASRNAMRHTKQEGVRAINYRDST
jgi:hypothetical protein